MTQRADISVSEAIVPLIADALLDVHTAIPGIVKSFNALTGTVDVQPAVKRALAREDGSTAFEELPLISNVRVEWPGAGGFELRFPLAAGDVVMLVFAEVDTGQWEQTGQVSKPAWLQRHGLGSPVARPFNRVAPVSVSPNAAQIVTPSPLHVGNPLVAQFVALSTLVDLELTKIWTMLNAHMHTSAAPGSPTTPPVTPCPPLVPTASKKLKAE